MKANKITVTSQIDRELFDRFEIMKRAYDRSKSYMIAKFIAEAVEKYEQEKK